METAKLPERRAAGVVATKSMNSESDDAKITSCDRRA